MVFKYQWATKGQGNYAIQKRDTKTKKGGKEIEPKNKQTTKTHYFLMIDKDDVDTMYNLYKINNLLKTITYEYKYKGTGKKSLSKYLTKTDIEKVLENIEGNKGKTITIEITPPRKDRDIKARNDKIIFERMKKFIEKTYGKSGTEKFFELTARREEKKRELKEKMRQLKMEIKEIEKEITAIERELYEKIRGGNETPLPDDMIDVMIKNKDFQEIINTIYKTAKIKEQKEARNERQKKYRERKNIKEGKPIRAIGRP